MDAQTAMMINTPTPPHITFQKKKKKKVKKKFEKNVGTTFVYILVSCCSKKEKKKKERMYTMIKEKITHASTLALLDN